MSESVKRLVIAEREAHPHWGAKKLLVVLESRYPEVEFPCAGTIHNILDRAGLVKKRRRRKGLGQETSQIVSDGVVCGLQRLVSPGRWLGMPSADDARQLQSLSVVLQSSFRDGYAVGFCGLR